MRNAADVRSLDALRDAKAAVAEFREAVTVALSEAMSDVQRTLWWVQNDRRMHWEAEAKRRTEKVNEARSELYRAKLAAMNDTATCVVERKALQRAEDRLEEAHRKIRAVQQWARLLDRELALYRGAVSGITRLAEAELPRGEAKLDLHVERLQRYLSTAPAPAPPAPPGGSARAGADGESAAEGAR
jgi:hypothetical protein